MVPGADIGSLRAAVNVLRIANKYEFSRADIGITRAKPETWRNGHRGEPFRHPNAIPDMGRFLLFGMRLPANDHEIFANWPVPAR
jgi:hypothetical protein